MTAVWPVLGTAYAYLLPLAAGAALLDLVDRRQPSALGGGEKFFCGFPVGFGIQSLYMFFLGLGRIRFSLFSGSLAGWLILAVWVGWSVRRWKRWSRPERPPSRSPERRRVYPIAVLCALLIAAKLAMSLFAALSKPAYFDDTVSIWNYRAKVFYLRQSLVLDPRDQDFLGGRVQKYPPGIPLFKAWTALCLGRWSEGGVNLITFFCYLSLVGVAFANFRRLLEPPWDWALTLAAVSIPLLSFHALFAYVDIIVAAGLFGGAAYFYQWVVRRDRIFLLLSALLAAPILFTKDEGMILTATGIVPPLILFLILQRKSFSDLRKPFSAYLGILAIWGLPWYLTKIHFGFPISLPPEYRKLEFHPEVLSGIRDYLFSSGNFSILFATAWLLMAFNAGKLFRHPLRYPALAWGGTFIVTIYPFVFSPFSEFMGTAFARAVLNSTPLLALLAGAILAELTGWRARAMEDESSAR